jgi:hypothetical protein
MNDEKKELKQYLAIQNEKLDMLKANILTTFNSFDKCTIVSDWLKTTIDIFNFPEKYTPKSDEVQQQSFFDAFDEFMKTKKISDWRFKAYCVVIRTLKRYEIYIQDY